MVNTIYSHYLFWISYYKVVRTRSGLGSQMAFKNGTIDYSDETLRSRMGTDYSDDPDGDGEGDEGILYQISFKFIWDLLSLYLPTIFYYKHFLCT